ncbi:MAG: hypothetical protein ACOYEP_08330, partial [Limnochordia bacterium]
PFRTAFLLYVTLNCRIPKNRSSVWPNYLDRLLGPSHCELTVIEATKAWAVAFAYRISGICCRLLSERSLLPRR